MKYYLAIDIGASSGRHILGHLEEGKMVLEEVYRFPNGAEKTPRGYIWDTEALVESIIAGMKKCSELGKIPSSVAIDTWGVDYMLLDRDGKETGPMTAYRDGRTDGVPEQVAGIISDSELYTRTGIQRQVFNTIYQLYAHKRDYPRELENARRLLLAPDYFAYRLTGCMRSEYTDATTTGLVNAESKTWDTEILRRLELPAGIFGELTPPGTLTGRLLPEIREQIGYDCDVVQAASHDTASAVMAVPARDENAVYISSGTWSLMGVENPVPITTEESRRANFTNEGGYAYRYRYLKNIMGLWIIQSVRHNLNDQYSFQQLEEMAVEATDFPSVVDVNDGRFLMPDSMIEAIRSYCRETAQPVPETPGEIMQCAYRSLAGCYSQTVRQLEEITGRRFTSINIVGGGSKDGYLNRLTAQTSGLPVFAGPSEGTAIGNLICQMLRDNAFTDLAEARACVAASFRIREIR